MTKRFLLYFRLIMVAWILIANAFFHAIEFEYSWLIFLSNIMLFTMESDIKDRFISVELGGLVGMALTVLAMLAIGALTPESELLVFSSFFSQRPGSKDAGALHFYVDSAVFPCYNGVK